MHRGFFLYLLNQSGEVEAGEEFSARGYLEAADTAAIVYDACSDVFSGYELWRGRRRLLRVMGAPAVDPDEFDNLATEHQEQVAALEESLKDRSRDALTSRKLLGYTDRYLAARYSELISLPAIPEDAEAALPGDPPDQQFRFDLGACIARVARQQEIAAAFEKEGRLDTAATARAVLATFQKSLVLLLVQDVRRPNAKAHANR